VAYIASFANDIDPKELAQAAISHGVPTMTTHRAFVEAGGLMGYYPSPFELGRRLGAIAGKVVGGVAPGTIPMEYISRNDLVLNEKTASALRIGIPPMIRLQATEVFA
jgi:putative ABC transport system substrate-binding protein